MLRPPAPPVVDRAWPTLPKCQKACLIIIFEFLDEIHRLVGRVASLLEHATVGIMGPLVQASSVRIRLEAREDDEWAPTGSPFPYPRLCCSKRYNGISSSCWYSRRTILSARCNRRTAGAVRCNSICPQSGLVI